LKIIAAEDFSPAQPPQPLADDEIHLWLFPHWETSRDAAASAVVRSLLAAYLNCAADAVHIERGEYGKPRVVNAPVEFNVTHSGDALLSGLSRNVVLGVDLEVVSRRTRPVLDLARRWFTPREADSLAALPVAQQHFAFLRLWTCKEAVLKAQGHGISHGLARFEFELSAAGDVQNLRAQPDSGDRWQVCLLAPDARLAGAVAWRGAAHAVRAFVMQSIAAGTQSG
jgi:4'-phosphopantetheinyl transferase